MSNYNTSVLDRLKNFDADRFTLDELIELYAAGKAVSATYEHFTVEEPDNFTTGMKSVARAIKDAVRDNLEREEMLLQAEIDGLKTRSEKLTEKQSRLAAIQQKKAQASI